MAHNRALNKTAIPEYIRPLATALRKPHTMDCTRVHVPQRLSVDKRANQLIEQGAGDDDNVLTSSQVAQWLKISVAWLNQARIGAYGPPYAISMTRPSATKNLTCSAGSKSAHTARPTKGPSGGHQTGDELKVGDKFVSADDVLVAATRLGLLYYRHRNQNRRGETQVPGQAQAAEQAQAQPAAPTTTRPRITRPTA